MQRRTLIYLSFLATLLSQSACMKAERLGTDTSSPEGFVLGGLSFGLASATYTVGGTVSGYAGTGLQLSLNAGLPLSISANGPFSFPDALAMGEDYDVTAKSQPPGQYCDVVNGAGTATSDVSSIAVECHNSGTIDTAFGNGGRVVWQSSAPTYMDSIKSLIVLSDDSVIASGLCTVAPSTPRACVMKYSPDGRLNSGFGSGGVVTIDLSSTCAGGSSDPRALVVQTDGRIVIAGSEGNCPALARLNVNGTPDASFGTSGIVNVAKASVGNNSTATGLALQNDGSLVFPVAYVGNPNGVARIDSAGSVTKYVPTSLSNLGALAGIAVQSSGRVVVGGYGSTGNAFHYLNGFSADLSAADSSFGSSGNASINVVASSYALYSIFQQSDEKILTCGQGNSGFTVTRFTNAGSADATFANSGRYTNNSLGNSSCFGITQQSDGKIVAVGLTGTTVQLLMVVRLLPDGSPDTNFGNSGIATANLGYSNSQMAWAVGIDSKGRVIAGGSGQNVANGPRDFLIIRLWP